MLDFLPEKIRGVLLEYPLITDFLNGKITEKLFLEDLKAFRDELISKKVPTVYVDNFELLALVETIRNEAGFIIHVHAGGRGELNDIPAGAKLKDRWEYRFYTRGFYRIKLQKDDWSYTGDQIELATQQAFGNIPGHGLVVPSYHDNFDVVTFGVLPVSVHVVPLSELIEFKKESTASYLRFTIRTKILDNEGRWGSWPHLIMVGDEVLVENIFKYTYKHPRLYDTFINLLVDRKSFPNVNKGILDKREKPSEEIVIINTDSMWDDKRRRKDANENLLPWVIKKYGVIVKR